MRDLCIAFGEPSPTRILQRMSMRDFNSWLDYFRQCGLPHINVENLLARQAWQFACANRDTKKGSAPKLEDFIPRKASARRKHQSDDEIRARARIIFATLGIEPDGQRD